jgi:hypothetical protein
VSSWLNLLYFCKKGEVTINSIGVNLLTFDKLI